MRNQPNERLNSDGDEQRTDDGGPSLADDRHDGQADDSGRKRSTRWVQLAYDLEQYGEGGTEQRGEVF